MDLKAAEINTVSSVSLVHLHMHYNSQAFHSYLHSYTLFISLFILKGYMILYLSLNLSLSLTFAYPILSHT